ncbi:MAG: hypothetical protein WD035_11620 [Balneolaceae bacterium]
MTYSQEDLERFKSYEKVHLRKVDDSLSIGKKIEALQKKDRNKWMMLLLNALAVIFFSYSYYFDITALSDTIFIVLLVIFTVNVGMIFLQKKQIRELIEFYRSQDSQST